MAKELRSGYSTGTHATAILGAVLHQYINQEIVEKIEVLLPQGEEAFIDVKYENMYHFSTIKTDNDDIDVTKGCCMHVHLYKEAPSQLQKQDPSLLVCNGSMIYLYAGDGVGVVTKKGLKIKPFHPAINPVPLEMMKQIASDILDARSHRLHVVFSVDNGAQIAKQTANAKVGVIGGISILGTRGIVKPISAGAYIDSIEAEIGVVDANGFDSIVFTLGNSALDWAKKHYDETQIVEIGNFIYDASERLKGRNFKKVVFITSVAKMCKVAQGFKNTHNRYGSIHFDEVKRWLIEELDVDLGDEVFLTLKAVLQTLPKDSIKPFVKILGYKAGLRFKEWFEEIGLSIKQIEIITLENSEVVKEELKW